MTFTPTRRALLGAVAACALAAPGSAEAATAKNVMLFITDGASWGTFDMASYWQHGKKNAQPYADFDVKLGMTTEPYSDPQRVYDPQKAWDTTETGASDGQPFKGYDTSTRARPTAPPRAPCSPPARRPGPHRL